MSNGKILPWVIGGGIGALLLSRIAKAQPMPTPIPIQFQVNHYFGRFGRTDDGLDIAAFFYTIIPNKDIDVLVYTLDRGFLNAHSQVYNLKAGVPTSDERGVFFKEGFTIFGISDLICVGKPIGIGSKLKECSLYEIKIDKQGNVV